MPTIKEYTSPIDKLTPDERGFTAWETAGRRIGPLYNQAAADIEKGGKLDEQALAQADKLNTHELDYLGLLSKQQQHAARGGGGGVSGGGGRTPADEPLRTYNPGPQIANAAANITGVAAALTGHQEGRGIYSPPKDVGASTKSLGTEGISISNGRIQIGKDPFDFPQDDQPGIEGSSTGQFSTQDGDFSSYEEPGLLSRIGSSVSSTLRSLAYGGADAASIVQDSQANQDAATPDFAAQQGGF